MVHVKKLLPFLLLMPSLYVQKPASPVFQLLNPSDDEIRIGKGLARRFEQAERRPTPQIQVQEGFVTSSDGVHLFYQVVGDGRATLVIPGRLFLIHTLQQLAPGRRLIFYDTRGRGKSDAIHDAKRETILDDVRDMEAVRVHFGAKQITPVGYSYMGLLVMLYTRDHPEHVERLVQLDPVPIKYDTKYPASLSEDYTAALDSAGAKKLDDLQKQGFDRSHPKEYCELDWNVQRFALVGDPAHVDRLAVPPTGLCDLKNEWPVNLNPHFEASFASIQTVILSKADLTKISMPVLTIHGTKDRNAPYGGGREWVMTLPNARLLTVQGGAHQSFDEYPEIVIPAINEFLNGSWPASAEKVTTLLPTSK
jgi:pimeloyl-ACP methyl ester carboxylesterase